MNLGRMEPDELRRAREIARLHGELTLIMLDLVPLGLEELAGDVLDVIEELAEEIVPVDPGDPASAYHRRMQRFRRRLESIGGGAS